jgi:thiol-disulfide isomerase/thioredoxin
MGIQKYLIFLFFIVNYSYITYGQPLKNLSGQPFPEEILKSVVYNTRCQETTLGQVLDSLKGNAILIDFWASWCKACITESEFTKEIQKDYKEEKIKFLFLSTDTDYKQWLRGLSVINLDGVHYRIDPANKKGIQDYLKIRGIPYYVLLDHENKIYDPKAPWPHLQKLRNELDMLLSLMKIK